jgi:hypothetical protein
MICKPKEKGGLGIMDFGKQNEALLMKHLHKFYNKEEIPCVKLVCNYYPNGVPQATNLCGSFWWRDIMKLVDKYRAICTATPGCGDSILFWHDKWSGIIPAQEFPRLHSFALNNQLSVKEMFQCTNRAELFYRPLSQQAFEEYNRMQNIIGSISLDPVKNDVWETIWKDGVYTANLYYKHCYINVTSSKIYSWIWKCRVLLRIKVFAWLLVSDRLNTKDMLRRRHWTVTNDYNCVLCPCHITEDWVHLFFECNFSRRIWTYLQIDWIQADNVETMFIRARAAFAKPFFTEIVILACWHIWKVRNGFIFQHERPSFRAWVNKFKHEVTLHAHRIKDKHAESFRSWIETLL